MRGNCLHRTGVLCGFLVAMLYPDSVQAQPNRCQRCLGSGRCQVCGGEGRRTCSSCDGSGRDRNIYAELSASDDGPRSKSCSMCRGTGTRSCYDCGGSGHCKHCDGGFHYGGSAADSSAMATPPAATAPVIPLPALGLVRAVNVAHNETQDGELGMTISVAFEVWNVRGATCRVGAAFAFTNSQLLMDCDQDERYRAPNGNVAARASFEPPYDDSVYSDCQLFIPYSQLHLARGRHNLCFIVGVVGPGDQLLATSDAVPFWVRR